MNRAPIITSSKQHTYIKGLIYISELLTHHNIPAAQGLRLIHKNHPQIWRHITTEQDYKLSDSTYCQLINNLQEYLGKFNMHDTTKPDHFLLTTNLTPPNLSLEGRGSLLPSPDIHFVRTQRRYNKRRYARVRATSRPSFWAGMLLSTLVTGAFWNASLQELDWVSTTPLVLDINVAILMLYIILAARFFRLYKSIGKSVIRERSKSQRGWLAVLSKQGGNYIKW
jgi:hypothetical protein